MKNYKIIVDFRVAYRKLDYVKNKPTVEELNTWINTWCHKNQILKEITPLFQELATAYADKDLFESFIYNWQKNKRKS